MSVNRELERDAYDRLQVQCELDQHATGLERLPNVGGTHAIHLNIKKLQSKFTHYACSVLLP